VNNFLKIQIEKISYFLLLSLIILFPLNQQFHIRPFPNIEGVIIDYLILKVSLPEILLIIFTFFNISNIVNLFKFVINLNFKDILLISFLIILVILNIFRSNYLYLAAYENLIILLIVLNALTLKNYNKVDLNFLLGMSLKFWMCSLIILGSFQVYFQESVLDNYYYFGEFTYSSNNYHIKQDGFILDKLIPAYGIFSHSNIYGGFFLISLMLLHLIKKQNAFFVFLGILGVFLSGSMNILIGLVMFLIFFYLKINFKFLFIYPLFLILVLNYLSLSFANYSSDLSIYRRLYMVNLSNNKFLENPTEFVFGFGYFNYFREVSENLYTYEIIRFFQPPHNVFYFYIWNYGFLFLISFIVFAYRLLKDSNSNFQLVIIILISVSMLDHFLFTNHQLKMLLFLILPYSIKRVVSIKMN